MRIEFLRALEDHTWDTHIEDVPDDELQGYTPDQYEFDAEAIRWALENIHLKLEHRKVVMWAVYSVLEQGEEDV